MKIGILGSGSVGQQLANGLLKIGHEVKVGTRDVTKLSEWLSTAGQGASVGSFTDAAQFGDVVFICTLWMGTEQALTMAGKDNFDGKIVVDVTNPLDFSSGVPPKFVSSPGHSGAEKIQLLLPGAKIIKAFNTVSAYIMVNAPREEGVPDMFIAGADECKPFINELGAAWGWHSVIDLGDLSQAYLVEAFAMIWIQFGFKNNNWTHAFRLLKK
jgi:predicted dinucleotide-binding enzyme